MKIILFLFVIKISTIKAKIPLPIKQNSKECIIHDFIMVEGGAYAIVSESIKTFLRGLDHVLIYIDLEKFTAHRINLLIFIIIQLLNFKSEIIIVNQIYRAFGENYQQGCFYSYGQDEKDLEKYPIREGLLLATAPDGTLVTCDSLTGAICRIDLSLPKREKVQETFNKLGTKSTAFIPKDVVNIILQSSNWHQKSVKRIDNPPFNIPRKG